MDIVTIGEVLIDLTQTGRDERGIPQFAADRYIEKILEHHGVLLAEAGQEPKYILSHAEALRAEQAEISEEPEQGQQTELVERDEDEIAELQELFSEEIRKERSGNNGKKHKNYRGEFKRYDFPERIDPAERRHRV